MKAMKIERLHEFDGLLNFRDIGGLPTTEGYYMKKGILFRSDELSKLSNNDMEKMSKLNIRLICDLRTIQEQKSKPSKMIGQPHIMIRNISIHDKSQEFTRVEFFKYLVSKSNTIDFEQIMRDIFANMANNCQREIYEITELLSQHRNLPALIHCTGGKDRTGFIAAILQLLVGVPIEKVMEDYLFSNELIAPRMKKVSSFIRWISLFRVSPEKLKPMLEVRDEYLRVVLEDIFKTHGDISNFLRSFCGISEERLDKLKGLLLE